MRLQLVALDLALALALVLAVVVAWMRDRAIRGRTVREIANAVVRPLSVEADQDFARYTLSKSPFMHTGRPVSPSSPPQYAQ